MSAQIFIDGAAGTTGIEIAQRLADRDDVTLIALDNADRKDAHKRRDALNDADLVILCLPDEAALDAAAMIDNVHTKVIDASSMHRIAPGWTYGFPEFRKGQRQAIGSARFVSNPGCYPTGFLALMVPLIDAGLLAADRRYSVHAVSGYSGGGKSLIQRYGNEPDLAFRAYALGLDHKHVPEMQVQAGLAHPPLFTPSVINGYRGMLVEIPVMDAHVNAGEMRALLADHYADDALVTVHGDPGPAELLVRDGDAPSDRLDLYVFGEDSHQQARLIAILDNLGKGASGACVQNMNLMLGFAEYQGLRL